MNTRRKELVKYFTAPLLATAATTLVFSNQLTYAAEEIFALEEIVVTAQKREQSVQKVAISMSAFNAAALERMGAINMEDVARNSPGLTYNTADSIKSSRTVMRGISSSTTAGADPSVGYYIDEAYLGSNVGSVVDLFDVERIEVLRGPQGTLFGRNTIGGVINITSKRPTEELSGYVKAEYGNYNHTRIKASLNGALSDNLLGSLSALYYKRDGTLDNVTLNTDTNDINQFGIRGTLLFEPTDNSEFLLSVNYQEVDQKAQSMETLENNPGFSFPGIMGALLNTDPTDRKVFADYAGKETLDAWGISLRSTFGFDDFDLISVTSYRTHDYFVSGESDQTPIGIGRNEDPEFVDTFTQELRLTSTGDGDFNWIFGLYYLDQNAINDGRIILEDDVITLTYNIFLGMARPPGIEAPLLGGAFGDTHTSSYAAFANFDYAVTEKLEFTLGVRYSIDKKDIKWAQTDFESYFFFPLVGGTTSFEDNDKWEAFTPAFTARYQFNEEVMGYATVNRGFKSGGYNDGLGNALNGISFDPEFLWNYEAGFKSFLFDKRLMLNMSVFHMKWKDIQLRTDDPSTPDNFDPRILNGGSAHSTGFEMESTALLTENLTLNTSFTWLEAEYDEGTLPTGEPLGKLTRSPDYTFTASLDYEVPLTDNLNLSFRGEIYGQGEVFLGLEQDNPNTRQEAYELLSARISLSDADGTWQVGFWGRNLANKTYHVGVFDLFDNPFVGQYFSILGSPRTYGMDVRFNF